jgi:SAM-dependent methyltransferase
MDRPYYGRDLALVHHWGYGFHADACAPGILRHLEPVLDRGGLVVELGCGSGLLTRYLIDAGHRVIATDASPDMLWLAREHVGDAAEEIRLLALPDDPIPPCDAIVSVGHVLNYLPTGDAIDRALHAAATSLQPGGVLTIDLCDFEWGELRREGPNHCQVRDDWAIITEFSTPTRNQFIREMAVFLRNDDGTWRRNDERHDNILIDVSRVPTLLAEHGVDATVQRAFGDETLPDGLYAIVGTRPAG